VGIANLEVDEAETGFLAAGALVDFFFNAPKKASASWDAVEVSVDIVELEGALPLVADVGAEVAAEAGVEAAEALAFGVGAFPLINIAYRSSAAGVLCTGTVTGFSSSISATFCFLTGGSDASSGSVFDSCSSTESSSSESNGPFRLRDFRPSMGYISRKFK